MYRSRRLLVGALGVAVGILGIAGNAGCMGRGELMRSIRAQVMGKYHVSEGDLRHLKEIDDWRPQDFSNTKDFQSLGALENNSSRCLDGAQEPQHAHEFGKGFLTLRNYREDAEHDKRYMKMPTEKRCY